MFKGHQFCISNEDFVFDLTDFIGYKTIKSKDGNIAGYEKAYKAMIDTDRNIEYVKYRDIPSDLTDKTNSIIRDYMIKLGRLG